MTLMTPQQPKSTKCTSIEFLVELLKTPRPSHSHNQVIIRNRISSLVPPELATQYMDSYGNLFMVTPQPSPTMFTAHLDTVGQSTELKTLSYNPATGIIRVTKGDTLGADDSTGVWIMLNMIHAGVPGTYAFFMDEETGGQGSHAALMQDDHPIEFVNFERCVSFDRMGTDSIITHQGGSRTASDAFAEALAKELEAIDGSLEFLPDDTGSFTDSCVFESVIPECTNISVGYKNQHTSGETQDLPFARKIADACCQVQWDQLPCQRDPSALEDDLLLEDLVKDYPSIATELLRDVYGCEGAVVEEFKAYLDCMDYEDPFILMPTTTAQLLRDYTYVLAEALHEYNFSPLDFDLFCDAEEEDETEILYDFFLFEPLKAEKKLEELGMDTTFLLNLIDTI